MLRAGLFSRLACAVALSLSLFAGCKPTAVTDQPQIDPTHERLLKIGLAYREFNEKNKRPPAKADDLKASLPDESIWKSARDEQLLVVIWNVDLRNTLPGTIIAYEKFGKDGKRLVRTAVGSTEEMSQDDFVKGNFPPGHKLEP